ncbi:MAG TPA: aromatic-ring-hydroxylating dioxygenase subunit beta [Chloroflexota bacterium]|nr:aromatic-ring-hydroxylating dioxygenase subunit beta [Chloroflexota bacterium]
MTAGEAEQLLIHECRLIDERRFDEWLGLFAEDALYWLPITDGDPAVEPSLIYDDKPRLRERIFRLTQTRAPSQDPPSRTLHNVSNVALDGRLVRCHLTIHEYRPGDLSQVGLGQQRVFPASAEYEFTPEGLIRLKKVWLLTRDAPQYNLTFIF